jgi:hypothetical protein
MGDIEYIDAESIGKSDQKKSGSLLGLGFCMK